METKLSSRALNLVVVLLSKAFLSSSYALATVLQLPILACMSSVQFFSMVSRAMVLASFYILIRFLLSVPAAVGASSITGTSLGYSSMTISHTLNSLLGILMMSRYFSSDLVHEGYIVGPSSLVASVRIFFLIDILGS